MIKKKKSHEIEPEQSAENTTSTESNQEIQNEQTEPQQDLQKELAELQDKHIRLHAEFDNFRRRTLKEKSDLIKTAGESVLINVLPIIDDLDRALESMNSAQDVQAVKDGVELIVSKFRNFLKQHGIQEIEAKEQDFDTDKHEAITKIPAPTPELKGKVVDVVQKGYQLHDKVIRFSKVVIGE